MRVNKKLLLLLAEDSVRSLLNERLVAGSRVVANSVVNSVSDLVLSQLSGGLLRVRLHSGGNFVGDIFAASVGHVRLIELMRKKN